jgi:hypothetical protein
MSESNRNPLVDIGVSYVLENGATLSADDIITVRTVLERFLQGSLNRNDAITLLAPLVGAAQVIDKLDQVIRTPPTPLPNLSAPPRPTVRAKTRPWSPYEDQRLLAAIHRFGTLNWFAVACFVGNSRTKAQCHQRWTRSLDPNLNKERWTPEQDSQLLLLVALYGDKAWSRISADLGNRCDVQCRYRYKQLQKEKNFQEMVEAAKLAAAIFSKTILRRSKGRSRKATERWPHTAAPMFAPWPWVVACAMMRAAPELDEAMKE